MKGKVATFFGVGALALVFLVSSLGTAAGPESADLPFDNRLGFHGQISVLHLDAQGNVKTEFQIPNTITTAALNHIKYYLGTGQASTAIKYIGLGNGTAPAAGSTTLDNEWDSCGLDRATGTYYNNGDGNMTFAATFTASGNGCKVNTTGLFNATTGGTIFAGDEYVSTITVDSGDIIYQNWTIWAET